jgi:4-hydroxy-3-polyprenylbenzoate decarboxylase
MKICGGKPNIELPGEGFKRAWPPLIKMDDSVKAKVEKLLGK